LVGGVEVEAYDGAIVFAGDGISFAVAFYEVATVFAVDEGFAFGYGVGAAPKFDAVEHEYVGQGGYFVDGEHPEAEEYQFVDKFIAYGVIPGDEFVGQRKAADA
jgi:hypothetical protein